MNYELFGTNIQGNVEFLGSFHKINQMMNAIDQYAGMGYSSIKYCRWC